MNKQGATMQFTADQVWGLAVKADSLNEGYIKEAHWGPSDSGEDRKIKEANKVLVKDWLRSNTQPTEGEIAAGRSYRNSFNALTLKALTGKISDFERQALRIAQMDEFTGKNMLEFAIVSCLPAAARREQGRTELKREVYSSEQLLGSVGDTIVGDITVLKSYYSNDYNKFKITARMGESFIDFWYGAELAGEVRIKGKIKTQRGDKTTQLNYVKKVG
jgi:hypothetical protein